MKRVLHCTMTVLIAGTLFLGAAPKGDTGKSAKIKLEPKRGFFTAPIEVKISTDAADAKVYFTTNGSLPTPVSGQLLSGPVRVPTTTVLRAAGYRDGKLVTEVDAHTYIFLDDVLKQTGRGFPSTWGVNNGQPVLADYEMDPEVVTNRAYCDGLVAGLKSLPTFSVTMETEDLFGAKRGIYANPLQTGDDWERVASLEYILPDGAKGFQIDAGIRIQGGWNRRPEESPKHAFRVTFRKKYGAGKLKYELFREAGVDEFDQLILRAGCNNSWLHWNSDERRHGDYLRDQWMRDTHAAMGRPAARGRFVHLYLNGLYWGLYNLTERPNEDFAAQHLGGTGKDYDARNSDEILEGDEVVWKQLFSLANAGLSGEKEFTAVRELLDLPAFMDFMILNLYGANADWDRASNWYVARRRNPAGKFQFFAWDGERTLENSDADTIRFDDDLSPPRLFHKLRENPEFRLQFADRVQRHLFGDGSLSSPQAAGRFRAWADRLDEAIIAESTRWGDYRRDVHPYKVGPYQLYTRDDHWRPEVKRITEQFFPRRPAAFLKQLRTAGLYPKLDAPTATVKDGKIEFAATSAIICFSLDGSDPRLPGGKLSPTARKYEHPVAISAPTKLKARTMTSSEPAEWSALVEIEL